MADTGVVATSSKSLFRRECAVTTDIAATPETIWKLLTDADDMLPDFEPIFERYAADLKAEAESASGGTPPAT